VSGIYVVSYGAYDGGGVMGVYSTRELANAAMTTWANDCNTQDAELAALFPDDDFPPRELLPYLPAQDDDGNLFFKGGVGDSFYVEYIEVDQPCAHSWDRAREVKHL